ncbi:MATE family efflux transporter [Halodurantibacterium flavum]|uniref:MATE family efflux transporter n=1 Tax=Halodurantibacterium flavum TaxID=1382802 RepID=A0ABW4S634_9RHOB
MSAASSAARPLWRPFLVFLLPMMATNILQSLSMTINNIFLGRMLGFEALAAASVFFPVAFLFIAFLIGLSAGATVLVGQAQGAGAVDKIKAVAGTSITVALAGGILIAGMGWHFAAQILTLLGTPAEIFGQAVAYARMSFLVMPFTFLFLVAASLLRGTGDTVRPLMAQIFATILGAALTPALIQGWIGLPPLGAPAAALAAGLAFLAALVALGGYLSAKGHVMAPDRALLRAMRPDPALLALILRIGLPTGVQVVAGSLAGLVIVGLVNAYGVQATAAYGAVSQIISYVQFPALSISIAASVFGAQMIGRGRPDRLGEVLRTAMAMNLILTGGLVLIVYAGSRQIIGLFLTDPAIVDLSQELLHIVAWAALMFGAGTIFSGIMRASGTVLMPMVIGLFAILGVEIPVAVLLSGQIGLPGIWWGYVASFAAMMVLQGAYFGLVWRRKTIHALI